MPKDPADEKVGNPRRSMERLNAWILFWILIGLALLLGYSGKPAGSVCPVILAAALLIADAVRRVRFVLEDILDELRDR